MTRVAAALSLIAAMTFTGANVPIGKVIAGTMPIYAFLFVRFVIASAALAVLVRHEPGPPLRGMSGQQWGDLVVLSLVGSVLYTLFIIEGSRRSSATEAGIITATIPAAVAVLGLIFFRVRPSLRQVLLIGLAVAGLAVMALGPPGQAEDRLGGNLLVGCAVVCEASFVVVSQRMSRAFRPIRLSFGVSLAGMVMALPLAIWEAQAGTLMTLSAGTWVLVVWYALTSSAICTILWYRGAGHVEPWMAGLATAALPVSAVVVAIGVLGEPVTLHRLAGAAIVVAAIAAGALLPEPHSSRRAEGPKG